MTITNSYRSRYSETNFGWFTSSHVILRGGKEGEGFLATRKCVLFWNLHLRVQTVWERTKGIFEFGHFGFRRVEMVLITRTGCLVWLRGCGGIESEVCSRKRHSNCWTHDTKAATDIWILKVRRRWVVARSFFVFPSSSFLSREWMFWGFFHLFYGYFVYLLTFGNKNTHKYFMSVYLEHFKWISWLDLHLKLVE